jgi:hypothetical protein
MNLLQQVAAIFAQFVLLAAVQGILFGLLLRIVAQSGIFLTGAVPILVLAWLDARVLPASGSNTNTGNLIASGM